MKVEAVLRFPYQDGACSLIRLDKLRYSTEDIGPDLRVKGSSLSNEHSIFDGSRRW